MATRVAAALLLLLLTACSSSHIRGGGGETVAAVLAQPLDGPLPRLVIAPLRDQSSGRQSIARQRSLLIDGDEPPDAASILGGIRDLLGQALFDSGRFTLLEREELETLFREQDFEAPLSQTQQATLEGADLLLLGAVTAFDTGNSGGIAFPVPIPLGDDDIGILDVEMRTAYVAMDLRLVEVASGRVLATTAVEGRTRKFGIGMSRFYHLGGGHLELPGLLAYFQNTPMEQAIMKMAVAASRSLAESLDPAMAGEREEWERQELESLLP